MLLELALDALPTEPLPLREDLGLNPELIYLGAAPSHNWAKNKAFTRAASIVETNTPYGRALDFSSAASAGLTSSGGTTAAQTRCTFIVVYRRNASNAYASIANLGGKWSIGFESSGVGLALVKNGIVALTSITPNPAADVLFACSHDTATGEYWSESLDLNGANNGFIDFVTQTDTNAQSAGDGSITVNANGGANTLGGYISAVIGAHQFLPYQRWRNIRQGPQLALFEPDRIWVPVAAINSYSLTADQGSFTLTGQAAGLTAARTMAAAQGSFALTGQDAGLLFGHLLTAGQGSYSLTGQDASLTATRLLTAAQGSFSLTGQDAGLYVSRALSAGQGSYALSGQDATLTYSPAGAYTITADAGSFTLTGQADGLSAARLLTAAQGSYSLTGQDASLLYGVGYTLTADAGAFSLTGQAAELRRMVVMTASHGVFTLTGRSASLDYSGAGIVRYSAPPLGHGPGLSQRISGTLGRRGANLSTRKR